MSSSLQANEDSILASPDAKIHRLQESSGGQLLAGAGALPDGAQMAASLKPPGHLHRDSAAESLIDLPPEQDAGRNIRLG